MTLRAQAVLAAAVDTRTALSHDPGVNASNVAVAAVALLASACSTTVESGGEPGELCSQPQDSGPCRGALLRWWFNAATGKCEPFVYGGCEGNANNFETLSACAAQCAPTAELCSVADCGPISGCVYLGPEPTCEVYCEEGCAWSCVCAASCPSCDDCIRICPAEP